MWCGGRSRDGIDEARELMADLADAGISIDAVTDQLQADGVEAFSKSFQEIAETTGRKADEIRSKVSAA